MWRSRKRGKRMKTVAVLGYGGRGGVYSSIIKHFHISDAKVTAVIDTEPKKLEVAGRRLSIPESGRFESFDTFLEKGEKTDWLFICTQDKLHIGHVKQAIAAGYKNILLEKPVSVNIEECMEIERLALENNVNMPVCHVLRYTNFYSNVKSVLDSGVLGKILSIEMVENIGYWHFAHSYVRGNWRRKDESCPMILAKCCHDLDLAVWFANSTCKKLTSEGKLTYFTKENAPEGCADRCIGCELKDCPYDARKLYLKPFEKHAARIADLLCWPAARIVPDGVPTYDKLVKALQEGPYGRCAFKCDNDVADYQTIRATFDNDIAFTLTATAFGHKIFRTITIRGTEGELIGNFEDNSIDIWKFDGMHGKKKKLKNRKPLSGHGGGDSGLIAAILKDDGIKTSISMSMESHAMALASEESRLNGGAPIIIADFKKTK
jgi:predicted dehydrogenase